MYGKAAALPGTHSLRAVDVSSRNKLGACSVGMYTLMLWCKLPQLSVVSVATITCKISAPTASQVCTGCTYAAVTQHLHTISHTSDSYDT